MSFTLSEDVKKELRVECMKEAYKHFKLIKTISDNTFYLYLTSQNLKGFQAAGDNNKLSFRFPLEMTNHITDGRIKLVDFKLPGYHTAVLRGGCKFFVKLDGGILKRNNYVCGQGEGTTTDENGDVVGNGNFVRYENILSSIVSKQVRHINKISSDPTANDNSVIIFEDNTRALAGNATAADGADNIAVGGFQSENNVGYECMVDGMWRPCNNPASKEGTITIINEDIGIGGAASEINLTRDGAVTLDWTATICVELLPDFMRNDRIMY
jgi:hypothetical protein